MTLSDDTLSLICSLYEGTFHIGEKEAASTILLTPFLMAAVKILRSITSRNFKVDGEFVVYSLSSRGRNPASDLAIIVTAIMPNRYRASDLMRRSYSYLCSPKNAISAQSRRTRPAPHCFLPL